LAALVREERLGEVELEDARLGVDPHLEAHQPGVGQLENARPSTAIVTHRLRRSKKPRS